MLTVLLWLAGLCGAYYLIDRFIKKQPFRWLMLGLVIAAAIYIVAQATGLLDKARSVPVPHVERIHLWVG